MATERQKARDAAKESLQRIYKEAKVIRFYTQRSGPGGRYITVLAVVDGELRDLSMLLGRAQGYRLTKNQGAVCIGGSGFNPAQHAIENLGWVLGLDKTPKYEEM
jgi:hypothetical protein